MNKEITISTEEYIDLKLDSIYLDVLTSGIYEHEAAANFDEEKERTNIINKIEGKGITNV